MTVAESCYPPRLVTFVLHTVHTATNIEEARNGDGSLNHLKPISSSSAASSRFPLVHDLFLSGVGRSERQKPTSAHSAGRPLSLVAE